MKGLASWRVARIRGVDLNIHVSLLLLLPYLIFITVARFVPIAAGAGVDIADLSFGPLMWGFVLAIALFGSVVLHEFGHVWVAQSYGVKVKGVTLMMLGGVSNMERMPDRPYSEFKLAVVGPLVSLAIAGVMFLIRDLTSFPDVLFFTYWLGSVNLILAIFNMLPAFPLDGGRALRSVLAARQGMVRATQNSVKISKVFAWVLGILGLLGFNILLMLIAFFIYTAAQSELFFLLSKGALKGLKARDVAIRVPAVTDRDPVSKAAQQMVNLRVPILPVTSFQARDSVMLVTLEQIRRVPREYWQMTLIKDLMEETPKVLNADDTISEVLAELATAPMGTLPVKEDGQVIGLVRYSDVSEILQYRSLTEAEGEFEGRRAA